MNLQQAHNFKQGYFSLWLISCITLAINISIFLFYHFIVVPLIECEEVYIYVTGPILNILHFLQICFLLLYLIGFGAIIVVCRWQKTSFTLFLLCSLQMLIMFLLYAIPQGIVDLYQADFAPWSGVYLADRILFMIPSILLLTSFLYFIICTIALLGKIWLHQYVIG